jgi:hypothetical protein
LDWEFVIFFLRIREILIFVFGGDKDGRMDMDTMKSCAFSPEETAEEAAANVALVERDGFSVEDLLDLEEFGEPDKDDADAEDAPSPPAATAAADATEAKKSPGDSQPSSVVTYELPPPPTDMVDLPVSVHGRFDPSCARKDGIFRESSSHTPCLGKTINLRCCVPAGA